MPEMSLQALACRIGLECRTGGERVIRGVNSLELAAPDHMSYCQRPYRKHLQATHAGAVLITAGLADLAPCPVLICDDPKKYIARVMQLFPVASGAIAGVHPTAVVDSTAVVAPSAAVGAMAVVGARARIAAHAEIGAHAVVGDDCVIGEQTCLAAHVVCYPRTCIGAHTSVHAGTVLGSRGYGLVRDGDRIARLEHYGGVRIGDHVELGANSTIDRGTFGDTEIGDAVTLGDNCHIGHNTCVGRDTVIGPVTGIGGSVRVGQGVQFGGMNATLSHLSIADNVVVEMSTVLGHSVPTEGARVAGNHYGKDAKTWHREQIRLRRLLQRPPAIDS